MKCFFHSDRDSHFRCTVCGKPLCEDCTKIKNDLYYCPEHFPIYAKYDLPSNTYASKHHKNHRQKHAGTFTILFIVLLVLIPILTFAYAESRSTSSPKFGSSHSSYSSDNSGSSSESKTMSTVPGNSSSKNSFAGNSMNSNTQADRLTAQQNLDKALSELPSLKGYSARELLNIYNAYETYFSASPYASDDEVTATVSAQCGVPKDDASLAYFFVCSYYDIVRNAAGYEAINTSNLTVKYGKLVKAETYGSILDITAKIEGLLSDSSTITQNYFNVCDLIQNQGADIYTTINYTATMPTTDGSQVTVVSFVVPKTVIDTVKQGKFAEITLGEFVDDLWIHPQLTP